MMEFELLPWDSAFFGFGVARIELRALEPKALGLLLDQLRGMGVTLVYWPSDPTSVDAGRAAQKWNGFLADRKITYGLQLGMGGSEPLSFPPEVEIYRGDGATDELRRLALLSGKFSRFKVDPRFPPALFEGLYHRWIENAVAGMNSEEVWIHRMGRRVAGLVTLRPSGGRAAIGLIAVEPEFSGRGIGSRLVEAGKHWAIEKGYGSSQVVTQGANSPACALYEKCGYTMERIDHFYHFWLKKV